MSLEKFIDGMPAVECVRCKLTGYVKARREIGGTIVWVGTDALSANAEVRDGEPQAPQPREDV